MQARMKNPTMLLPGAMDGIQSLLKAVRSSGVPEGTLELVHLRTSQINGCAACIYGGSHAAKKAGMSDERLWSVAAWREAPFYTDAERAALELAEERTRLADRPEPVGEELWERLTEHFDEPQLGSLIMMIGLVNVFNRVNATLREPAGQTWA
jgi:AhpD family alkylhydroperoxidase